MNIDAHLAKAVTKFANKKMHSPCDNNSSPIYRSRLEKMIANAALDGKNSIEYYVTNDEHFYAFLITMENELKKEGFKFTRKADSFLGFPTKIVISWR